MSRKRLTQYFPFLLPIRRWQRKQCFYLKMACDKQHYTTTKYKSILPYLVFTYEESVINEQSGHDIKYQYNKMENLKLASATINKLVIRPNETFSYWQCQKNNQERRKLKEGLVLIDNKITYGVGGGLCQLSNLLFYLALNSPLDIVERHHHTIENIPNSLQTLDCCDATISEGWCDLKFKNNTNQDLQIIIEFSENTIKGGIYSDTIQKFSYVAFEKNKSYVAKDHRTFIQNDIYQKIIHKETLETSEHFLLHNEVEIGYELGENI